MLLIPAIDLKDGHCVRLKQGDMDQSTTFSEDPAAMARRWLEAGARRLHLVDLNGAFAGKPQNHAAIKAILKEVGDDIPVQLGGGIRDLDTIERYIDDGLRYVIIGTAAVKNPGFLKDACSAFGGHIIVGLDAKDGKVATDGWSKLTGHEVADLGKKFEDYGVESIIYTDIGRDGMLSGINIEATVQAGAGAHHPGDRLGRPVEHGRHRQAVRGRGRRRRGRDLRPRDLLGRPRFRRRAGARRRTGRTVVLRPRCALAVDHSKGHALRAPFFFRMLRGEAPVQGTVRSEPVNLRLGFAGTSDDSATRSTSACRRRAASAFSHDPEIKREAIWSGPCCGLRRCWSIARAPSLRLRGERSGGWETGRAADRRLREHDDRVRRSAAPRLRCSRCASRCARGASTTTFAPTPTRRRASRSWAPTRRCSHDGADLAAALQTIREIGDDDALDRAVDDAFPGCARRGGLGADGRFETLMHQHGLLRPLSAAELSDGTLRYLLWIAALLTPRPPAAHGAERARDQPGPAAAAGPADRAMRGRRPGDRRVPRGAAHRGARGGGRRRGAGGCRRCNRWCWRRRWAKRGSPTSTWAISRPGTGRRR